MEEMLKDFVELLGVKSLEVFTVLDTQEENVDFEFEVIVVLKDDTGTLWWGYSEGEYLWLDGEYISSEDDYIKELESLTELKVSDYKDFKSHRWNHEALSKIKEHLKIK